MLLMVQLSEERFDFVTLVHPFFCFDGVGL
jgi:hypothetical protein